MFLKKQFSDKYVNSTPYKKRKLTDVSDVSPSSDLLITNISTDGIGRHEVLLPINHNHYNFRKAKK